MAVSFLGEVCFGAARASRKKRDRFGFVGGPALSPYHPAPNWAGFVHPVKGFSGCAIVLFRWEPRGEVGRAGNLHAPLVSRGATGCYDSSWFTSGLFDNWRCTCLSVGKIRQLWTLFRNDQVCVHLSSRLILVGVWCTTWCWRPIPLGRNLSLANSGVMVPNGQIQEMGLAVGIRLLVFLGGSSVCYAASLREAYRCASLSNVGTYMGVSVCWHLYTSARQQFQGTRWAWCPW